MKSKIEYLFKYNKSIRDIINSQVLRTGHGKSNKPVIKQIKNRLKISKEEDWHFICAALDVIDDTTSAIKNFVQYKIDGPTKYDNYGEKILRLYGFLNAVYVQQGSIKLLYKIFSVKKKKEYFKRIDELEIIDLRHKLASHNVSYLRKDNLKDCIVTFNLIANRDKFSYVALNTEDFREVDFKELLDSYLIIVIDGLDNIYEKIIKTIYKTGHDKRKDFEDNLKYLRIERKGGIVIKNTDGNIVTIIKMTQGDKKKNG